LAGLELLALSTILFSFSMGYHYAGAVVGSAYGGRAVRLRLGLVMASVLVLIGTLATPVSRTYSNLYSGSFDGYSSILLGSFIATSIATYLKIPTSTIQIFTFSALASALVGDGSLSIGILAVLMVSWVLAPVLSYTMAPLIMRITPNKKWPLLLVMVFSALVLGTNDIGMAASFLGEKGLSRHYAAIMAGFSASLGLVVWGSRLVKLVGDELGIHGERRFLAAQSTKIAILLILNSLGLNASMNQTLIGALAGLGARGKIIRNILMGWALSPVLGLALSMLVYLLLNIY